MTSIRRARGTRSAVACRRSQQLVRTLVLTVLFGLPAAASAQSLTVTVGVYYLGESGGSSFDNPSTTTVTVEIDGQTFVTGEAIDFSFRGDPVPGADFTMSQDGATLSLPYRLTPTAGSNSVSGLITILDDEEDEAGEYAYLTASLSGTSMTAEGRFMITGSDRRPVLVNSWIDGTVVKLVFDRPLLEDLSNTNTRPDLYFKMEIKKAGETSFGKEACPIMGGVVVRGNTVTLTFPEGVQPGDMARLTYRNMSVNTPIQDLKGQNAATFTVDMLDNRTGQTPTTKPGRPNNLMADPDDGQVTLNWDPPTNTGGTEALTYQWRQGSTGDWKSTGTQTTKIVTGLGNGTTYTFYVQAVNSAGAGPAASTTGRPAGRPGAPQNLMAQRGNQQVTLSWDAPANTGGLPLTYEWREGADNWTSVGTSRRVTVGDLENGNTYTFEVRARNSSGPGPGASVPAKPATFPGMPENLRVEPGNEMVTLFWDAPDDDGGEDVTRYEWRQGTSGSWMDIGLTFTKTVGSLTNGTTYTFQVRAINDVRYGPHASVTGRPIATPEAPGLPRNLKAQAGDVQVTLTWDPPASNGGATITRYEWSQDPNNWLTNQTTTTRTVTITNLNNGTAYTFYVRARNFEGPGDPASVTSTPAEPTAPGAPTNFRASPGNARVTLSWSPPTSNGGSEIIEYQWSQDQVTWNVVNAATLRVTATDLNNDATYTFYVRAKNSVDVGPAATTTATPSASGGSGGGRGGRGGAQGSVPGPPRNLSASPGTRQVDLSWSPPTDDGGSAITGYLIEVSEDGGSSWRALANTESTVTTFEHTGLDPQTTRHYRVYSINSIGTGPPSNVASATTVATPPGALGRLVAEAVDSSRIDLSWSAPRDDGGNMIAGYQIQFSADQGLSWSVLVVNTGSTETTYSDVDLAPGTTRYYRVLAINSVGPGTPSNVASATTDAVLPDAPQNLAAVANGTSRIDLAWSAPTFDGGSPVIGYRIDVASSPDGGRTMLVANTGSTTTEYSHGNLDPATRQYYRVLAINAEGTGPPSNVAGTTTDATVPDAPTNLGATATSTTRIDLTWNAPAYDGGAAVTGYEIEASDDGQSDWTALATSMTARYADLVTPGTTRHYRVRAVNAVGAGPPSGVASATTDDPKERANELNRNILPYAAAVMTASTVLAITDRVEGAATSDVQGPQTNLGGFSSLAGVVGAAARGLAPDSRPFAGAGAFSSAALPAASIFSAAARPLAGAGHPERDPAQDGTGGRGASAIRLGALAGLGGLDLRQSLGGTSFLMPLGTVGDGAPQETGTSRTMAWGVGDYRVLDGPVGRGDTDWAGDVLSLHVGADTRVRPDLLTGVALSRSTSAFEFSNRTGPSVVTGDYEADVTGVHPYAAWFAGERSLAVWTTVGYGGGGVSIEESTGDMRSGDTRFLTAAAGGSAIVLSAGAASLRAKSEAWMTRVDVEENSQMDAMDVDMRRARLAVEGSRAFSFDSGDELSLALETGLRYDGGDGAKSGALELGGGVRYARPSLGLVAEGRGRIMATRQDGYREWGFSGRIQIDPQTLGEGLALRLVPSWGDASGGVQRLWDHGAIGAVGNGFLGRDRQGSLNAEIEYGLRSFAGTPYGSFRRAERGTRTFNTGVRYQADMRGSLYLEASRREGASGPATQVLIFRGQWRLR